MIPFYVIPIALFTIGHIGAALMIRDCGRDKHTLTIAGAWLAIWLTAAVFLCIGRWTA